MPHFSAWQTNYGPDGLQVIGISMDDDAGPVRELLRKTPVTYPIIMGDEKLGLAYGGVLGLPDTYLIDRKGTIRARFKGPTRLSTMKASVRKLLESR